MDLDILPTTQHLSPEGEPDLIADGVITLQDAEGVFTSYRQCLDRFLYNILEEHDSLTSIRKSSPLLTAAVCVVGALHTFSPQYQACYEHFVQLASVRLFSKKNTPDDIRALCIAAFWLGDISSSLIGAAVRLASELGIHRHIQNARHQRDCYRNTRLFYLVCVCDRQLSITRGRPPLAWDFGSIISPKELLQSEYATKLDESLVSQLELWSISTQIFDRFYLDPDDDLPNGWIPLTHRLRTAIETWKVEWDDKLLVNEIEAGFASKATHLQYYFTRLYLCSVGFRRPAISQSNHPRSELGLEFAAAAMHSAASILQVILTDKEIQSYLCELPVYFNDMIAFTIGFLCEVTTKYLANTWIDNAEINAELDELVHAFHNSTAIMQPKHPLAGVLSSMRHLVGRLQTLRQARETGHSHHQQMLSQIHAFHHSN